MRKNTRRVLAFVMALALILGNFTGINMTAEAAGERAISDVSIAPGTGRFGKRRSCESNCPRNGSYHIVLSDTRVSVYS